MSCFKSVIQEISHENADAVSYGVFKFRTHPLKSLFLGSLKVFFKRLRVHGIAYRPVVNVRQECFHLIYYTIEIAILLY